MNKKLFATARSCAVLTGLFILALIGAGAWYFLQRSLNDETETPESAEEVLRPAAAELVLPEMENNVFSAGEKLRYNIIYKGVTVGHASIEVKEGPPVNDRPTVKYVSTAKSTKFFDVFFKVRDENASTVDKASLFSVAFDQDLDEGHYAAVRHYAFDYRKKTFASVEKKRKKTKERTGTLDAPVHDVLSALYFVRTRALTPGQDLNLTIFRSNGGQPLPIKVGAETTELKTKIGKISCLRVEPMIHGDSLFQSKDNKLVVWMTNDAHKIPVLMEASIRVGLIRVKLDEWQK